jgi:hypothetical protein
MFFRKTPPLVAAATLLELSTSKLVTILVIALALCVTVDCARAPECAGCASPKKPVELEVLLAFALPLAFTILLAL